MGLRTNGLWIAVVLVALSGCTAKTTCGGDSVDCGGVCVTMAADNLNCGACGNVCGIGTACVDGACALQCAAGQVACGGACVDPLTSTTWCGASGDCTGSHAGTFCASWLTCQAGACTCATSGQIACGGACLDPLTSATHCGASGDCAGANAGTACAAGETCQAGACACPTAGQVACGGACVDPQTSATYCGASGNCSGASAGTTCAAGETCQGGSCAPNCSPVVLDLDTPFATIPPPFAPRHGQQTPTSLWASSLPPLPTNTSWQNLVLGAGGSRFDAVPYQFRAEPVWLDVATSAPISTATEVTVPDRKQIMLGALQFDGSTQHAVQSHDLFSVTLRYSVATGTMTAPLVQGMPYVTVDYAGSLRPMLLPGNFSFTSVNGSTAPGAVSGTRFVLVAERRHHLGALRVVLGELQLDRGQHGRQLHLRGHAPGGQRPGPGLRGGARRARRRRAPRRRPGGQHRVRRGHGALRLHHHRHRHPPHGGDAPPHGATGLPGDRHPPLLHAERNAHRRGIANRQREERLDDEPPALDHRLRGAAPRRRPRTSRRCSPRWTSTRISTPTP